MLRALRRLTGTVAVASLASWVLLTASAPARGNSHGTCGSYCRQAGELGGNPPVAPCHVLSGRIQVRYGIASVAVRCTGKRTSRGALVIYPHNHRGKNYVGDGIPRGSYDGVDLLAPPGRKVTVRILLSRNARALLARKHRLLVDVSVRLNTRPQAFALRAAIPLVLG